MSSRGHNLLWRVLRRNISVGQLALYVVATFMGLSIVMCAAQLYRNVSSQSNHQAEYITLSRRASTLGSLFGGAEGFSRSDINRLQKQPWVKSVGAYEASQFDVALSAQFQGRGFSTALFFEAVPDEFLDIRPADWHFDPGQPTVPIILPREYLALYNFGFAPARGLPQLTEGLVRQLPLKVYLAGANGRQRWLPARVAGFSSRLNTIAVPHDFLTWANAEFGISGTSEEPSRLIVALNDPGDPAIAPYLKRHSMEVASGEAQNRFATTLRWVVGIAVAVGAVIFLLALAILLMSIFLLVQKTRQKLSDLRLLGYSVAQLAGGYIMLLAILNLITFAAATLLTLGLQHFGTQALLTLGFTPASPLPVILLAALFMLLLTLLDYLLLHHLISRR